MLHANNVLPNSAKMLTENEVAVFYEWVRDSAREGNLIKVVDSVCKSELLSRVMRELFQSSQDTVNEFVGNLDEPIGLVHALFGAEAAQRYAVTEQLLHIAAADDNTLGWLDAKVVPNPTGGMDEEDFEMYLHHLEKND